MANVNSPNPANQEQLRQQVATELNQLNSQFQYVSQQLSLITNYYQDLSSASTSLKEIKTKNVGEKILVPLSSRIFLPVLISEESSAELLVNIGSNILKKGDINVGIQKLESELESSKKAIETLQSEYAKIKGMIEERESLLS